MTVQVKSRRMDILKRLGEEMLKKGWHCSSLMRRGGLLVAVFQHCSKRTPRHPSIR